MKTKTTKITVELSTEQLELLAPACTALGCDPGEFLLSMAFDALEVRPATECAWQNAVADCVRENAAALLWRFAHNKDTPRVEELWAAALDINERFAKEPYVPEPAELAAG